MSSFWGALLIDVNAVPERIYRLLDIFESGTSGIRVATSIEYNSLKWINNIRTEAMRRLSGGDDRYVMEDYMKALYFSHVRVLGIKSVHKSPLMAKISVVCAAHALRWIQNLESGSISQPPIIKDESQNVVVEEEDDESENSDGFEFNEEDVQAFQRGLDEKIVEGLSVELKPWISEIEDLSEYIGFTLNNPVAPVFVQKILNMNLEELMQKLYNGVYAKPKRKVEKELAILIISWLILKAIRPEVLYSFKEALCEVEEEFQNSHFRIRYNKQAILGWIISGAFGRKTEHNIISDNIDSGVLELGLEEGWNEGDYFEGLMKELREPLDLKEDREEGDVRAHLKIHARNEEPIYSAIAKELYEQYKLDGLKQRFPFLIIFIHDGMIKEKDYICQYDQVYLAGLIELILKAPDDPEEE